MSYCALIVTSHELSPTLHRQPFNEVVDANGVCPGIHTVRVGPATRSAVATCIIIIITSGNRTPGSRFRLNPPACTQASFKSARLLVDHLSKK